MAVRDPLTRIAVHTSTLRILQEYTRSGRTYEQVILGFIERCPPPSFVNEMALRAKEPVPAAEVVYRRARI
jgi:hypothetical protein